MHKSYSGEKFSIKKEIFYFNYIKSLFNMKTSVWHLVQYITYNVYGFLIKISRTLNVLSIVIGYEWLIILLIHVVIK